MTILEAIPEDASEIIKLLEKSWVETYAGGPQEIEREDIERSILVTRDEKEIVEFPEYIKNQGTNYQYWVAKEKENVIGVCLANREKKNEIAQIFIESSYQHTGIGSKLYSVAVSWLGLDKDLYITVVSYNPAIDWWRRKGFVETGNFRPELDLKLPSGKTISEIEMIKKANL